MNIFFNLYVFSLMVLSYPKNMCIFASQKGGAIAQLVEQRTENPCVPGSIPGGTTAKKCKTT